MDFIAIGLVSILVGSFAVDLGFNTFRGVWSGYRKYTSWVFGLSFVAFFLYALTQLPHG